MTDKIKLTPQVQNMLKWYGIYTRMGLRLVVTEPRSKELKNHCLNGSFGNTANDIEAILNGANIGFWMGDGLFAIDFDTEDAYIRWANDNPYLSVNTPISKTHSGYHVLLKTPYTSRPKNGKGKEVTIISDDWYIVAPPSVHPRGSQYRWLNDPVHCEIITIPTVYMATRGIDTNAIEFENIEYYPETSSDREDEWK